MKTGTLSIHTENIFPIIKKFLYSNQEVFLRELVSNAVDATQKIRTLSSKGEFKGELGELAIEVKVDQEAKTLTISDKGVGMTAEEVEKYINQIAFSSAEEFLEKFKDSEAQIIGHFGLGFYSAFMVAKKVELVTRSWQEDAPAMRWSCEGTTEFALEETEKETRGTDVILHLAEDAEEFSKPYRIQEVLEKYGKFLPVEIKFEDKVINETDPLWKKAPSDLTDEDYTSFYSKLYPFSEPPLFWVHLNVDYPFTLTGILYFPKLRENMDLQKNKIQLYSNQVFITDSVEDVVPDYLNLLHGVIDSPDIPLNVSRSYLQTDAKVRQISNHISKKVADKLKELFNDDRKNFEEKWDSAGLFVKYGMMRDDKFFDRADNFCLFKTTEGEFFTMEEFLARVRPKQTDKDEKTFLLYATEPENQHAYIQAATKRGYDVLLMDGMLDANFISFYEHKLEKAEFARVDSDSIDKLIDKGVEKTSPLNEEEEKQLAGLYENLLDNKLAKVECQTNEADDLPVAIVRSEQQRRMVDMAKQGMLGGSEIPDMYSVVVNAAHPMAKKLLLMPEGEMREELARHTLELALLANNMLNGPKMSEFVERNIKLMSKIN